MFVILSKLNQSSKVHATICKMYALLNFLNFGSSWTNLKTTDIKLLKLCLHWTHIQPRRSHTILNSGKYRVFY